MAYPEVIELFDSGSGGLTIGEDGNVEREVTLRWLVSQKANYLAAEQWAVDNAPLCLSGHRRSRLDIRGLGNYWWEISAQYVNSALCFGGGDGNNPSPPDPESDDLVSSSISFDTTNSTAHITQANSRNPAGLTDFSGQSGYAAGGLAAPDTDGAIDIEGDQVRGVDVTVPAFSFTETWSLPSAVLIDDYVSTLYSMTGKINNARWRNFDTGEVLFLGARGDVARGNGTCQITFSFSASPNKEGIKIGSITGINKGGWDYLTVTYKTETDAGSLVKRPQYVYVNSVYEGGDFSKLKLGTRFPRVFEKTKDFTHQ